MLLSDDSKSSAFLAEEVILKFFKTKQYQGIRNLLNLIPFEQDIGFYIQNAKTGDTGFQHSKNDILLDCLDSNKKRKTIGIQIKLDNYGFYENWINTEKFKQNSKDSIDFLNKSNPYYLNLERMSEIGVKQEIKRVIQGNHNYIDEKAKYSKYKIFQYDAPFTQPEATKNLFITKDNEKIPLCLWFSFQIGKNSNNFYKYPLKSEELKDLFIKGIQDVQKPIEKFYYMNIKYDKIKNFRYYNEKEPLYFYDVLFQIDLLLDCINKKKIDENYFKVIETLVSTKLSNSMSWEKWIVNCKKIKDMKLEDKPRYPEPPINIDQVDADMKEYSTKYMSYVNKLEFEEKKNFEIFSNIFTDLKLSSSSTIIDIDDTMERKIYRYIDLLLLHHPDMFIFEYDKYKDYFDIFIIPRQIYSSSKKNDGTIEISNTQIGQPIITNPEIEEMIRNANQEILWSLFQKVTEKTNSDYEKLIVLFNILLNVTKQLIDVYNKITSKRDIKKDIIKRQIFYIYEYFIDNENFSDKFKGLLKNFFNYIFNNDYQKNEPNRLNKFLNSTPDYKKIMNTINKNFMNVQNDQDLMKTTIFKPLRDVDILISQNYTIGKCYLKYYSYDTDKNFDFTRINGVIDDEQKGKCFNSFEVIDNHFDKIYITFSGPTDLNDTEFKDMDYKLNKLYSFIDNNLENNIIYPNSLKLFSYMIRMFEYSYFYFFQREYIIGNLENLENLKNMYNNIIIHYKLMIIEKFFNLMKKGNIELLLEFYKNINNDFDKRKTQISNYIDSVIDNNIKKLEKLGESYRENIYNSEKYYTIIKSNNSYNFFIKDKEYFYYDMFNISNETNNINISLENIENIDISLLISQIQKNLWFNSFLDEKTIKPYDMIIDINIYSESDIKEDYIKEDYEFFYDTKKQNYEKRKNEFYEEMEKNENIFSKNLDLLINIVPNLYFDIYSNIEDKYIRNFMFNKLPASKEYEFNINKPDNNIIFNNLINSITKDNFGDDFYINNFKKFNEYFRDFIEFLKRYRTKYEDNIFEKINRIINGVNYNVLDNIVNNFEFFDHDNYNKEILHYDINLRDKTFVDYIIDKDIKTKVIIILFSRKYYDNSKLIEDIKVENMEVADKDKSYRNTYVDIMNYQKLKDSSIFYRLDMSYIEKKLLIWFDRYIYYDLVDYYEQIKKGINVEDTIKLIIDKIILVYRSVSTYCIDFLDEFSSYLGNSYLEDRELIDSIKNEITVGVEVSKMSHLKRKSQESVDYNHRMLKRRFSLPY